MEGLKAHKVVDVAVGALHCLAVTEEGEVIQLNCIFIRICRRLIVIRVYAFFIPLRERMDKSVDCVARKCYIGVKAVLFDFPD